jgi:TRAP-type C4-dicarboxylate transport system substrate-binding protein
VKRIIAITVTVLLVSAVIFGGCAEPAEEAPTTPTEPTEPTEPAKPIEWRFASFIPPFDCYAVDAEDWAKDLEEATGGRLKVSFYWAESLVKMPGLHDAISAGTADIGMFSAAAFPARFPLAQIFNLAMIYKSASQAGPAAIALINKYKEFQDEFYPMKVVWYQGPGPTHLLTKEVPVRTMEDLEGLKIRASGNTATNAYQLLGASPLYISSGEVYQALETGVIDGDATDWNAAFIWKRHEVTKYRIDGIFLNMNTFPTVMNIESHNKLPEDIKGIFDELTDPMEITKHINEGWMRYNLESLEKLKEFDETVGNPPFYVLPEAERERWKEVVWPLNEEWVKEVEAKGLPGEAILADAIAFAEQYE